MHERPGVGVLVLARIAVWLTVGLWLVYMLSVLVTLTRAGFRDVWQLLAVLAYLVVISLLTLSATMYLVARVGAYERFGAHRRASRAVLDAHFADGGAPLTVLIPSYEEEPQLVRKAVLSAALQEYPRLRVVVLVDDDPAPGDPDAVEALRRMRELGDDVMAELAAARALISPLLGSLDGGSLDAGSLDRRSLDGAARAGRARAGDAATLPSLAAAYRAAAGWLEALAAAEPRTDHVGVFFADSVLGGLGRDLARAAEALETAHADGEALPADRVAQLRLRLERIFAADVATFERKRYASLSHEPNKAMNLNSYLGLLGGRYRELELSDGVVLRTAEAGERADLVVPDCAFVLTLDADSMLLPDYCLRLVHALEQPQHARVAIAQTPYSSFRGAPTRLERLASATTDVQHIVHQGMARYGAGFWVGANAVIRREALEDLRVTEQHGAYEISRFVHSRTVIEDTESTVDLLARGWSLLTYPERLSYSVTPRDFGSLVIQRRRWANGGLLVLPRLIGLARTRRRQGERMPLTEYLLRVNYLASIAWSSFGLLVLMFSYPFNGPLVTPLLALIAVPYFAAMADDLHRTGYRRRDIVGSYGLNLLLLFVNLAGVVASLRQALTGRVSRFVRTPKVSSRVIAPMRYLLAPFAIAALSAFVVWRSLQSTAWGTLAFAAVNLFCAAFAIVVLLGLGRSLVELWIGWTDWLWVAPRARAAAAAAAPADGWRTALDVGDVEPPTAARRVRRRRARPVAGTAPVAALARDEERAVAS